MRATTPTQRLREQRRTLRATRYPVIPAAEGDRLTADLVGAALLFAAVSLLGLVYVAGGGTARETLFTTLLINATVVVGMQVFIGNTGILSFGHVGFGAVAGYAFAILAVDVEWKRRLIGDAPFGAAELSFPPLAAIAAATGLTLAVALIVGLGIIRSGTARGDIAATVITLAVLFAAYEAAINWTDITGGNRGGISFRPGTAMPGRSYAYASFALALVVALLYRSSRSGRLARAGREDDLAARTLGVNPARHQMLALLLSIGLVAIGACLRVWLSGTVSPERFFIDYTLLTLTMLVVGGRGSVTGAVVGSVIVTALTEFTRIISGPDFNPGPFDVVIRPGLTDICLGLAMLGFMILRPKGLLHDREVTDLSILRRLLHHRGALSPDPLNSVAPTHLGRGSSPTSSAFEPHSTPADTSDNDRLEVVDITVEFDGLAALSQAHLSVARGRICGLIGPNGAGKTTMLNVLSGIVSASSGHATVCGRQINGLPSHTRAHTGLARTFQNLRLFADLTVQENLEVVALAHGASRSAARQYAAEMIALNQLSDVAFRRAGNLDYGASKRLELARAAVSHPLFLLLDEPTSGFTEAESRLIVQHIRAIAARISCGVVVIDHDLAFITAICDEVYCLDQGSVIAQGSVAEIRSNPAVRAAYTGE